MTIDRKADANASRAFFVRMLTRDISLEDCLLDLLDNSVDNAWKFLGRKRLSLTSGPDFKGYSISIDFSPKKFTIKDNCGGMSLESAEKYAFTFGRKDKDPADSGEFSIGVYGIGLKRAIFKLGTNIRIRSTFGTGKNAISFAVPIKVKDWVENTSNNWDFDIVNDKPLDKSGLSIEISELTPIAVNTFENPEFERELRRTIARDYALHFHRGLTVIVNGSPIKGEEFKLYRGGDFAPLHESYDETIGGKKVHVEIVSGFAFPPPDSNEPQDRSERENKSGWYIACNGRIVMAADKSSLSVWGNDFPAWHPQYTGFFGLIIFTSDNTELLPLTTTKRSVDVSSVVYSRARPKMKVPTRAWVDYTNIRKSDQDGAKAAETKAQQASIFTVTKNASVTLPKLQRAGRKQTSSIQFSMPMARIKSLARGLGDINLSNSEVGRKAFDYAYDELVEE